jgi:ribosomal protein L13E
MCGFIWCKCVSLNQTPDKKGTKKEGKNAQKKKTENAQKNPLSPIKPPTKTPYTKRAQKLLRNFTAQKVIFFAQKNARGATPKVLYTHSPSGIGARPRA